jgi:hypothetical protein
MRLQPRVQRRRRGRCIGRPEPITQALHQSAQWAAARTRSHAAGLIVHVRDPVLVVFRASERSLRKAGAVATPGFSREQNALRKRR